MKSVVLLVLLAGSAAHADSKAWTSGKSVIPSSATVVGGMSAASARSSGLYNQFLPLLLAQAGGQAKAGLDAIKQQCDLDVLGALDSVAFGVDDAQSGVIVIALKGTNRKALEACGAKLTKADSKTLDISADGKLTKYVNMGDKPVFVQWLAADVVAITTAPDDKDASTKLLAGGVTANKAMTKALGAVKKDATMWVVVNKDTAIDGGGKVSQVYGNAVVANKKITFNAHAVTDSAATATTLSATATKKLADAQPGAAPSLQAAISTVSIKASGPDIVGSAAISEDDIVAFVMTLMK
jgi:hypothetical protein